MFNADDATVIGNVTDINQTEFLTATGFETAGVTVSLVVVVRTTTGNEKSSAPVSITRPAGPGP